MACVLGDNPAYDSPRTGDDAPPGTTTTGALATSTTEAPTTTTTTTDTSSTTDTTAPLDPTATSTGTTSPTCPEDQQQNYWPDGDGDGYGYGLAKPVRACDPPTGHVLDDTDCDDDLAGVHPGVDEVCNGLDDDCDDVVDTAACEGCTHLTAPEYVYWVCTTPILQPGPTWAEAEDRCEALVNKHPVHLLSVHEPDEYATLLPLVTEKVLPDINGTVHAWIGLSRLPQYSMDCNAKDPLTVWQWTDGTAVDVALWNDGEPSNATGLCVCGVPKCPYENCTEIKYNEPGQISDWNDIDCATKFIRGYVCKTQRDPDLFPLP